jgi:hypothetical protein
MKLYTEEQLEIAMAYVHAYHESDTRLKDEEILKKLTPIELPSDEEIYNEAQIKKDNIKLIPFDTASFQFGALWLRDKIQEVNNGDKKN